MFGDEDEADPTDLSRQPFVGPLVDCSIERTRAIRGQMAPELEHEIDGLYGRELSGVEDMRLPKEPTFDPTDQVYSLEHEDDVLGSGIFDPSRRPGTANQDLGVFASANSIPGYLAREDPFTVSADVVSEPSGAEVVNVPAGGMFYVERRGRPSEPRHMGPVPHYQHRMAAKPTGRFQPYALQPGRDTGERATAAEQIHDAQPARVAPSKLAFPSYYREPVMKTAPASPMLALPEPAVSTPASSGMRQMPQVRRVPVRPAVMQTRRQIALPLSGDEPKGSIPSWVGWGVGGVAAGIALFMVFGKP